MSKTIQVSVEIDSSIEKVWKEASRLENHVNWMVDAKEIVISTNTNHGIGTIMKVLTKVGPIKLNDIMTITSWVEEKEIGVEHQGIVSGHGKFTLNIIPLNKTLFTWEETLNFPIFLLGPFGEFFGQYILKFIWQGNLNRLKNTLEQ